MPLVSDASRIEVDDGKGGKLYLRPPAWADFLDHGVFPDSLGDFVSTEALLKNLSLKSMTSLTKALIIGWSYPDAVTPENVARIDTPTMLAAMTAVMGVLEDLSPKSDGPDGEGRKETP